MRRGGARSERSVHNDFGHPNAGIFRLASKRELGHFWDTTRRRVL
jgi:hypothetical protein